MCREEMVADPNGDGRSSAIADLVSCRLDSQLSRSEQPWIASVIAVLYYADEEWPICRNIKRKLYGKFNNRIIVIRTHASI